MPELRHVVIAYETEAACRFRLAQFGFAADIAAEIAVYLAQATDLPGHMDAIRTALAAQGLTVRFVELDDLAALLPHLDASCIVWCQTDGIRYYRGSAASALTRLAGIARFGAPPTAQHLCQDKFACSALAHAAGLSVPPTWLLEGREVIAQRGGLDETAPLFVKPNTLGAKIGIFADSRCAGLEAARDRAERIWRRYGDRAVVQPYLDGDDIRANFLDLGDDFAAQLGLARLEKNPASETGGAFMTMRDNETLSGASDTAGGRGGFGVARPAAFVPRMVDLRSEATSEAVAAIESALARLARLLRLTDLFSADFRLLPDRSACFLEFEVCPAVTIYDFQDYLGRVHHRSLGEALAISLRRAHASANHVTEA